MKKPEIPFVEFPKISRFSREVIVTEKIDGTNAQIYIPEAGDPDAGQIYAGSRTKWITPEDDNHGFARWVESTEGGGVPVSAPLQAADGGEWWGSGIQRGYGLKEKRFSLFNVHRWGDPATRPACCHVVPTLWRGNFDELGAECTSPSDPAQFTRLELSLEELRTLGSRAAPGFMKPEGVVIFHTAGSQLFKKTIEKDDQPKGAQR